MAIEKERAILLVEDDPDHEMLTIRALRKASVPNQVRVARDGEEALAHLFHEVPGTLNDLPHIVLLDLKLPKIEGLEVLRRIRETARTRTLPVVILTSSDEERDILRSYRLGANSYVRKPVNSSEFADMARHLSTYWLVLNECPPIPN